MRVVVDANVILAAMLRPAGHTAATLLHGHARWFAPAALEAEVARWEPELCARRGIPRAEWRRTWRRLTREFVLVPEAKLRRFANHPLVRRVREVDPQDATYAACAIAVKADVLWSFDARLRDAAPSLVRRFLPDPW